MEMSNDISLSTLFKALQRDMLSQTTFSAVLSHPVDKGDNAEECWIGWFNKYLPNRYRAAKATLIDSTGQISDQIDIVIYDSQYSYLAFNQNNVLYLPAESAYAVFEVKQDLNKSHLEYASRKAESVRSLKRTSAPIPYAAGVYKPKPLHHIIAGILTTKSGWEEPFGNPFSDYISQCHDNAFIDCGCVLESGAFFVAPDSDEISISSPDESLVFFFLQLLILLQKIGTVPAIDLCEYMKALHVEKKEISIQSKEESE